MAIKELFESHTDKIIEATEILDELKDVPTQSKTVTPGDSTITVTPDDGYFLESVTVEAASTSIINSTIEEFYAESGEIDAKTFIQFVRSGALYNGAQSVSGNFSHISAAIVSDTRFLVYYTNSGSGTNRYLSLFEINGTTINVITTTTISTSNDGRGMYDASIEKINDTTFVITYVNASNRLYARIATVSGNTIALGTAVQVNSNAVQLDSSPRGLVTALSENKIVFFFRPNADNSRTYYAVSASISGTTITIKNTVTAFTLTNTGTYFGSAYARICKIDENRACIMVTDYDGSNYHIKVATITISSSYTITVGSFTTLATNKAVLNIVGAGGVLLTPIDNTKVLATYMNSSYSMVAMVLTINSNNTITVGTAITVGVYVYAQQYTDAILFDENTIIVCGRTSSSNETIKAVVLNLSNTTLSTGISYNLGYGDNIAALAKSTDRFIVLAPPANTGLMYYDMCTTKAVNIAKPYVNSVWGVSKTKAGTTNSGLILLPKA